MVFKHGLIPLDVHSWLTANLAVTYARQMGFSREVQRNAWIYGLYHDAGVLSLQPGFEHSSVSASEVHLLEELLTSGGFLEGSVFPLGEISGLVEFAQMHAASHRDRALRDKMKTRFGAEIVDAVSEADNLATGREKSGYEKGYPVFRSFYDGFSYDSPYRALSLRCFTEHAKRQAQVESLISEECRRIAHAVRIPRYDPFITRSSFGLEYHMAEEDYKVVQGEYDRWKEGHAKKGDVVSFPSGVRLKAHAEKPCFCVLCGREAVFYKGIGELKEARLEKKALKEKGVKGPEARIHTGKGDVGRALGFELDTWRGMLSPERRVPFQDHQRGLCDECVIAIASNEPVGGIIVLLPKEEGVFERYYDGICVRKLRWWVEQREKGLCHQHPWFDDLAHWKETRDYSERLEGLDERRARYERVLRAYRTTVETLGAVDKVAYAEVEGSDETLKKLAEMRSDSAPLAYGCVKDAGWSKVAVNGFALSRRSGVQALRMILAGAQVEPGRSWTENLEEVRGKVKGLRVEDLDVIVTDYDRIVGAVAT